MQRVHSIHIRYENTTFPYQESRLGPLCVSQQLGGITGRSEPDSSQDELANTCSCMGGQGDNYVIVRGYGGGHVLIAWVRSHVGISGNEEADKLANWSSHLGRTGSRRTATEGRLRAAGKAIRAAARTQSSLRRGSQTRTERGPQRA